jgi:hypothetical protein
MLDPAVAGNEGKVEVADPEDESKHTFVPRSDNGDPMSKSFLQA